MTKSKDLQTIADKLHHAENQMADIRQFWDRTRPRVLSTWIGVLINDLEVLRDICRSNEEHLKKMESDQ